MTDLLQRIRSGDEGALSELLDAEWSGLVGFLGRRLPTSDAAQDAAQEAFVRLWQARETWRDGSARALLYKIGANVATDMTRRASIRTRLRREGLTGSRAVPRPDEELGLSEAQRRYRAALDELAPRRREVFLLVRREGLTYREVSEVLGLSPQTVANHMSLALRELRTALADYLPLRDSASATDPARSNDG